MPPNTRKEKTMEKLSKEFLAEYDAAEQVWLTFRAGGAPIELRKVREALGRATGGKPENFHIDAWVDALGRRRVHVRRRSSE
jgi:hypothetical protein